MADKHDTLETLKGNTIFDFQDFVDARWQKQMDFKNNFRREWDANHEKVEKKMDENNKRLEALREELIEFALGEDNAKNWRNNYKVKIVISKL
jgi:hypothetical protein